MAGWHHQLHGHEVEQTPGHSEDRDVCVTQSMVSQRAGYDLGTKQQQQNKLTKQERSVSNATKSMYEFSTKLIKYY